MCHMHPHNGPFAMFYPDAPWARRMGNVFAWIAADIVGADRFRERIETDVLIGHAPPAMVEFAKSMGWNS